MCSRNIIRPLRSLNIIRLMRSLNIIRPLRSLNLIRPLCSLNIIRLMCSLNIIRPLRSLNIIRLMCSLNIIRPLRSLNIIRLMRSLNIIRPLRSLNLIRPLCSLNLFRPLCSLNFRHPLCSLNLIRPFVFTQPHPSPVFTQPHHSIVLTKLLPTLVFTQPYPSPDFTQPYHSPVFTQPHPPSMFTKLLPFHVFTETERDWSGESLIAQDRQFTAVPDLYRLGAPRFRQLRMKPDDCLTERVPVSLDCVSDYSIRTEETTEYCVGWNSQPCPQIDQLRVTAGAWYFQSALDIWGIPIAGHYDTYGGGGYISNLDINLMVAKAIVKEMKDQFWIDRQTRAVFLEFTLYCANTNRFAYVILLAEFPPTGGVVPFVNIYPFAVYEPDGALGAYLILCEILGLVFTLLGLIYVIYMFNKEGRAALKDLWFVVDFTALIFAVGAIAMFAARLSFAKQAVAKMKEDPSKFVNFQHVVVWDTALVVCLAGLVAIGCIRLLKLAGYSKKTMRVYRVLKLSTVQLPGFFTYIFFILVGFAFLGMMWFGKTSYYYRNFLACMENLFTGILGKTSFKNTGLPEPEKVLTITFFIMFSIIVVHLLSNFFVAILSDLLTVNAQRNCDEVHGDNAKIFSVMWDSFLRMLGRKRDPLERLRKKKKGDRDDDATDQSHDRQFVSPEILGRLSSAFNKWLENQARDLDTMIICGDKLRAKQMLKSAQTPGESPLRVDSADPKKHLRELQFEGGKSSDATFSVFAADMSSESGRGRTDGCDTASNFNPQKMEGLLCGRDRSESDMSKATTHLINVASSEQDQRDV
ncbi:hypothetical protein RRG08_032353 [Elysia crispata]|uniref:Uncharacterized protein n=1 Tax=Elysia crispata TaxID=231223 RepID=A0AAE1DY63_9GAST|nr:hypothetical protein RRG08_032353 [Elysia crispata]